MRVFITGASGWIGSAVVDELLAAGHDVLGLARSDASAAAVAAKGATVLRGDLDDLDSLRRGAAEADAVVHLANKHDFAHPEVSNRAERAAVQTLSDALAGSGRRFVFASGLFAAEGEPVPFAGPDSMRGGAEALAFEYIERGVHPIAARFAPTTHGAGDHGFIRAVADAARRTGVSGYVGDGSHAWGAVHRSDAARLVRLGLESAPAGAKLHAVAESGVPTKEIAEAIGERLGLPVTSIDPERAVEHFGFIGRFFSQGMTSDNTRTRTLLGWEPTGPTLVEDIAAGGYDA